MIKVNFQLVLYSDFSYLDFENCLEAQKEPVYKFSIELIRFLDYLQAFNREALFQLALPPVFYELADQPAFRKALTEYLEQKDENKNILKAWANWEYRISVPIRLLTRDGKLELLASPVTGALLPFISTPAGIRSQINEGLSILEDYFHVKPKGFWFPRGAYMPGLDLYLLHEGFQFSYLHENTVKYGDPLPKAAGAEAVQTPRGLTVFPICEITSEDVGMVIGRKADELASKSTGPVLSAAFELTAFTSNIDNYIGQIISLADDQIICWQRADIVQEELEQIHLSTSALPFGESEKLLEESLLPYFEESFLIEKELEQLAGKIEGTGEEKAAMKQMIVEWCLLTGQIANVRHFKKAYADKHIFNYKQLKSALLAGTIRNRTDLPSGFPPAVLTSLSVDTWINEVKPEQGLQMREQKRKILMLTWEYPPNIVGGLARHVHGLSVSLAKLGYEVHVITALVDGLVRFDIIEGVYVHRVKPYNEKDSDFLAWVGGLNIAIASKAAELSSLFHFDFIHAHDWLTGSAAAALKKLLKLPLVVTIHATEHGRNNGIYTEMQRSIHKKEAKLLDLSDHVIVCSEFMKEELGHIFGTNSEKISVIANGIEKAARTENDRKGLDGLPVCHEKKLIFSIGRMVAEKGFETLIEAATQMRHLEDDIYFIIAGKGPMLEVYRKMVKDYQLENFVYLVGFINDEQRNALMGECSIAIFPSLYEPFGIVALEAMSFAKPVIVSETGGLKGFVQHGKTGLLMAPGSSGSLIQQAEWLLGNEQKAIEIGEQGRKMVESLFSWNRIAEETKRVFDEALLNFRI
ncbi:glycosyl transferase [Bacillus sp. V3-13]|uniref:glycosyltransferase n=1 Tax=Bacillus sp. V3-13 TaxID=2053728 RepID=UPI000C778EF0|nr:glycosyltransferase [Bacillus sp. V3-13]PLR76958.1 glycosyl transferase [Bacillus sp. V3-13]